MSLHDGAAIIGNRFHHPTGKRLTYVRSIRQDNVRIPWIFPQSLAAGRGVLTLLLALATQRDQTVRDYLIEKHAVQATRLVACEPAIDNKEEAAPLLIC